MPKVTRNIYGVSVSTSFFARYRPVPVHVGGVAVAARSEA